MHKNHLLKAQKIKKLEKKVAEERGITFKPTIVSKFNSKIYSMNPNLMKPPRK